MHPSRARLSGPNYSAVAKVVLESAARSGVVVDKNVGRAYNRRLHAFHHESKKRGGSLGEVTPSMVAKVSSPLVKKGPGKRPVVTNVPLLDVALEKPPPKKTSASKVAASTTIRTEKSVLEQPSSQQLPVPDLFERKVVQVPEPSSSDEHQAATTKAPQPAESTEKPEPTPSPTVEMFSEPTPTVTVQETPDADQWQSLRSKQISDIQRAQTDAEEERARLARHAEAEQLSRKWAASRPRPEKPSGYELPSAQSAEVYFNGWAGALQFLQESQKSDAVSGISSYDMITAHAKVCRETSTEASAGVSEKLERSGKKIHNLGHQLRGLHQTDPAKASEVFLAASTAKKLSLDRALLRRCVTDAVRNNGWEAALVLHRDITGQGSDPFCQLDASILKGLANQPFVRDQQEKFITAVDHVASSLRYRMPDLGKMHTLLLAKATRRWKGPIASREILSRFGSGGESDEAIVGELLAASKPDTREEILREARESGMNTNAGPIMCGLAMSMSKVNPGEAVQLFRRAAAEIRFTKQMTAVLLDLVTKDSACAGLCVQSFAATSGDVHQLINAVAAHAADASCEAEFLDIVRGSAVDPSKVQRDAMDALNALLKSHNFEPLTSVVEGAGTAEEQAPVTTTSKAQTEPLSEIMLEIAKEKRWEDALRMLEKEEITSAPASSQTLLFNCAISAAANIPQIALDVYSSMKARGVPRNATSYNTVLSALSKSDTLWETALSIFDEMPVATKDANSLSVAIFVLGKHSQWQSAASVFTDARSRGKVHQSLYGLMIQATHRSSWEVCLQTAQLAKKDHGKGALRELQVSRLLRALEDAGRTELVEKASSLFKK